MCLQGMIDTWCSKLGTDDEVTISTENAECNDNKYARYDVKQKAGLK